MTQGPELFYKPYGVGRTKGGIKLTGKLWKNKESVLWCWVGKLQLRAPQEQILFRLQIILRTALFKS